LIQQKEGGGKVTRSQAVKRARHSPFIIEVRMEEESLDDLENSDSSDLSDCIVIVYDN
jgi:hypothetical protein